MHFSLPILGSLFALASARCGTVPHPRVPAMHAAYQAHEATLPPSRRRTRRQDGDGDGDDDTYTVKVFVHVITSNNTLEGGNIPQETIDKQIEVLNGAYASAGFTFVAENATYTEKEEWRRVPAAGDKAHEMMSTLRQGKYRDLNIYLTTIAITPEGEALAYATLPDKASRSAFEHDGIVVNPRTLPGVGPLPYNKGITLVHETGHWLGLLHTFEPGNSTAEDDELAGCKGDGDYVQDTPAEASAAFGCQVDRDTCKGTIESGNPTSDPGLDPIHNYMDYSDDACLNTFTEGQVRRMKTAYVKSRIGYVEGDDGEHIDPEPPGGTHGG